MLQLDMSFTTDFLVLLEIFIGGFGKSFTFLRKLFRLLPLILSHI